MLALLADILGTLFLRLASRLLRYAERQYGSQVSRPLHLHDELPPRVEVIVEHLRHGARHKADTR